ncbi:MAG: nickel ABC transporter permease [Bacillota bacterium]
MLKYIARRLALLFFILFGVSFITFLLMHIIPGDHAQFVAIYRYGLDDYSAQELSFVRKDIGADLPLYRQYLWWISHVIQGDLGYSFITRRPVAGEILVRIPATLELAAFSIAITVLIALPLGILAARRPYSRLDNFTMIGSLIGVAIPNFWLGLLLILTFSLTLGILPVAGSGSLAHLVLPAVTLGTGMAAVSTRIVRASLLEVLEQDYVATARAKGLGEGAVLRRHALRNALIPVVTVLGIQLNHLIGGTVIVETVFARPGVGKLIVDAIESRDIPVLQGCVLFLAASFSLVNLMVDISYAFLDPRIRYEGGKS